MLGLLALSMAAWAVPLGAWACAVRSTAANSFDCARDRCPIGRWGRVGGRGRWGVRFGPLHWRYR